VLADADTDRLAQLRPGQPIRLRWSRARIATAEMSDW